MMKYDFREAYTILLYDENITHRMTDEHLKSHFSLRSLFIQRENMALPTRFGARQIVSLQQKHYQILVQHISIKGLCCTGELVEAVIILLH